MRPRVVCRKRTTTTTSRRASRRRGAAPTSTTASWTTTAIRTTPTIATRTTTPSPHTSLRSRHNEKQLRRHDLDDALATPSRRRGDSEHQQQPVPQRVAEEEEEEDRRQLPRPPQPSRPCASWTSWRSRYRHRIDAPTTTRQAKWRPACTRIVARSSRVEPEPACRQVLVAPALARERPTTSIAARCPWTTTTSCCRSPSSRVLQRSEVAKVTTRRQAVPSSARATQVAALSPFKSTTTGRITCCSIRLTRSFCFNGEPTLFHREH